MTIEIKTSTLQPIRNTYAHIERRFGDKPASRYQEASYDLAPTENFHYRPLWQPEMELYDPRRTAIVMQDWYVFRDPRQYYYGSYVQARAKLQEVTESNYSFFERRGLAARLPEGTAEHLTRFLLPLRHLELGANMNNVFCSGNGIGTVITQALLYNGMDRLGIAQYLSRIGLLLDENSGDSLRAAKTAWMADPLWQDTRRYMEDSLVIKDWFQTFIAQDVVLDTLVYDIFYRQLDEVLTERGAGDLAMLIEFMQEWHKETSRWVDSVLKTAVAESEHNRNLIAGWTGSWKQQALVALGPLAAAAVGDDAINASAEILNKRLSKAGL